MTESQDAPLTGRKATRASKPKVRTGCQVCKQRRVKCDETKPTCLRCQKANLRCSGYGIFITFKQGQRILPAEPIKQHPPELTTQIANVFVFYRGLDALAELTETENAAYDFCRSRTVNDLASLQCDHFWTTSVLSGCHSEPSILHAALALGSAHKAFVQRVKATSTANRSTFSEAAFNHYGKAVKQLRARCSVQDSDHLRVVLVVCVILLCFDLMAQRYREAWMHLEHGRQILRLLKKQIAPGPSMTLYLPPKTESIEDELVYCFGQLDIQSTNFGGVRPQFRLSLDPHEERGADFAMPTTFASVDDAARHMMVLLNECFKLRGICPDPKILNLQNAEAVATRTRLLRVLEQWDSAFAQSPFRFNSRFQDLAGSPSARKAAVLRMQHALLYINMATCLTHGDEVQFDTHIAHFTTIVSLSSALLPHLPTFNLDIAIIQPIYVVALHCRHPWLRRQAIDVLSRSGREGLWDSDLVETCAREVLKFEEAEANYDFDPEANIPDQISLSETIPASVRISDMWAFYPTEDKTVLRIIMRRRKQCASPEKPSDLVESGLAPAGDWEEIERLVPWNPP